MIRQCVSEIWAGLNWLENSPSEVLNKFNLPVLFPESWIAGKSKVMKRIITLIQNTGYIESWHKTKIYNKYNVVKKFPLFV
jgi:hypothetical protein